MKIKLFYLKYCPYCKSAFKALDELKKENPAYKTIDIELIEENEQPEVIAKYNYQYAPCLYYKGKKEYEARPGQSFAEIKANIKRVLELAC